MVDADQGHIPVFICHIKPRRTTEHKLSQKESSSHLCTLKKVSIHGIVIQQQTETNIKHNGRSMWLDDSTGVIRVLLSPRLCRRPDSNGLTLSSSVSVFGTINWTKKNEAYILCGGFHVDYDPTREIYHWIRVMQTNKLEDIQMPEDRDKSDDRQKLNSISNNAFGNRFQSLMSQPSPTVSQTISPISKQHDNNTNNNDNNNTTPSNNFLDDFDSQAFTWSPDHPFASSTPISRLPQLANDNNGDDSLHEGSPLRYPVQRSVVAEEEDGNTDTDEFGFDDDFALDNIDLGELERNALESRKRTFDDTLEETDT
ncbi:hypothetical protein BDC45DRAFT_496842 [Circinella umbellata]|nr:hypothetical protein BDC45DRAFT_496842 [Circinella umbellata]